MTASSGGGAAPVFAASPQRLTLAWVSAPNGGKDGRLYIRSNAAVAQSSELRDPPDGGRTFSARPAWARPTITRSEAAEHAHTASMYVNAGVAFALEDLSLVFGLTMMPCRGRVMWTISNERNGGPPPLITYGVTPDGFATRVAPKPLTPRCYEMIVSGPSKTRFQIGDDGHLIPD